MTNYKSLFSIWPFKTMQKKTNNISLIISSKIIILILTLFVPINAIYAFNITNFFLNKDQQGEILLEQKKYEEAAKIFSNQNWKAGALYRSKKYKEAQKIYTSIKTADGYYNKGNTLAHQEKYKDAINAYNEALKLDSTHEDAIYNRKIVEDLLQKQQQNQKQNQDKKEEQSKNENTNDQNESQQSQDESQSQNHSEESESEDTKQQQNETKDDTSKENQNENEQQNEQQENHSGNKQKNIATNSKELEETQKNQELNNRLLKLIPDDPGGLMREKFLRDHIKRQRTW